MGRKKVKASQNKAEVVEQQKHIETPPAVAPEMTIKNKITTLIQQLHINQDKVKAKQEELQQLRDEGVKMIGAIQQLQEVLKDLEQ